MYYIMVYIWYIWHFGGNHQEVELQQQKNPLGGGDSQGKPQRLPCLLPRGTPGQGGACREAGPGRQQRAAAACQRQSQWQRPARGGWYGPPTPAPDARLYGKVLGLV